MIAGRALPHTRKGQEFTSAMWNEIVDELTRLSRLSVAGASSDDQPIGQSIVPNAPEWFYAQITAQSGSGASAQFTWAEQYPTASGGWTAGVRSGSPTSDPAYEINGTTPAALPFVAVLRRDESSGTLLFEASTC